MTRDGFAAARANLFTATTNAARAGAKIAMWSENAAPVLEADRDQLLAEAAALAQREHIYLLVADRVYSTDGPGREETTPTPKSAPRSKPCGAPRR